MVQTLEEMVKDEVDALLGKDQGAATNASVGGANKFDGDKPRYDLIHPEFLEALAHLMTLGAKKYAPRNCEKGTEWGRWYRAGQSHLNAWWRGERYDPEDGQHHLISAAWNMMLLYTHEIRDIGTDDRHPSNADRRTMDSFWRDPNWVPKPKAVEPESFADLTKF